MEDVVKNLVEKISSYDILNNLFPGIIFCSIVERTTRITFSTGAIWEDLFIYYFAGMIISRIGSIFIEKILKSIKVRNKKTVFCKHFLEKNAKYFWRMLHLQIGESCKALTGSCSASHKPLQIIFSCYSTRYGNGSSEFSSSCACSLK